MSSPPPLPTDMEREDAAGGRAVSWYGWLLIVVVVGLVAWGAFSMEAKQQSAAKRRAEADREYDWAVAASERRAYQTVLGHLDEIERLGGASADHRLYRIEALYALDRYEEALAVCEQYRRDRPEDAAGPRWAGACQVALGRPAEARTSLLASLSLEEDSGSTHAWLADVAFDEGDMKGCEKHAQRAAELGFEQGWFLALRSQLLRRGGKAEEALALLRTWTEEKPKAHAVWYELGTLLHERRELDEAAAAFQAAARYATDPYNARTQLGRVLRDLGKLDEAERVLTALTSTPSADHVCWYELGIVYEWRANASEALRCFEEALRLHPGMEAASERAEAMREDLQAAEPGK